MRGLRTIMALVAMLAGLGFAFMAGVTCPYDRFGVQRPTTVTVKPVECPCRLVYGGTDYGCLDTDNCARFRVLIGAMQAEIDLLEMVAQRCMKEEG